MPIGLPRGTAATLTGIVMQAPAHAAFAAGTGDYTVLVISTSFTTDPIIHTIIEAGAPGYETRNWRGVAAPRGTPAGVECRFSHTEICR